MLMLLRCNGAVIMILRVEGLLFGVVGISMRFDANGTK